MSSTRHSREGGNPGLRDFLDSRLRGNDEEDCSLYSVTRDIILPRVQLWRILSHTDHLNRAIGLAPVTYADDAENSPDETLIYSANGWNRDRVLPACDLLIENHSAHDIWVALEKTAWDKNAASAALVTAMPEFWRWLGSEVLAPGRHVAIESLTLFFSDLRDSTQLYESAGDAPAYGRVRRHCDFLFEHIEANEGAIVKTIGDAAMAVFHAPENALRAAIAIQNLGSPAMTIVLLS